MLVLGAQQWARDSVLASVGPEELWLWGGVVAVGASGTDTALQAGYTHAGEQVSLGGLVPTTPSRALDQAQRLGTFLGWGREG